jgi:hypothetical protein
VCIEQSPYKGEVMEKGKIKRCKLDIKKSRKR